MFVRSTESTSAAEVDNATAPALFANVLTSGAPPPSTNSPAGFSVAPFSPNHGSPATVGSASLDANLRQLALLQALVARQQAQVTQNQYIPAAIQQQGDNKDVQSSLSISGDVANSSTPSLGADTVDKTKQWNSFLEGLNAPLPPSPTAPPPTPSASASLELPWHLQNFRESSSNANAKGGGVNSGINTQISAETLAQRQQIELDWWTHTVFTNAGQPNDEHKPSPPLSFDAAISASNSAPQSPVGDQSLAIDRGEDWIVGTPAPPPPTPFDWSTLYVANPATGAPGQDPYPRQRSPVREGLSRRMTSDAARDSGKEGVNEVHDPVAARAASVQQSPSRPRARRSMSTASAVAHRYGESSRSETATPPPLSVLTGATPEEVEEDRRRRNTLASARFRAKKKARDQQLHQSTLQLRNRVEELESLKNSLTAENKWLKDLVAERANIRPEVRELVRVSAQE